MNHNHYSDNYGQGFYSDNDPDSFDNAYRPPAYTSAPAADCQPQAAFDTELPAEYSYYVDEDHPSEPTPAIATVLLLLPPLAAVIACVYFTIRGNGWIFCPFILHFSLSLQLFVLTPARHRTKTMLASLPIYIFWGLLTWRLIAAHPAAAAALSKQSAALAVVTLLVTTGLLGVVGVIAARINIKRKRLEPVKAKCVDLFSRQEHRSGISHNGHHSHSYTVTTYCPVFEYTYHGQHYREKGYYNSKMPCDIDAYTFIYVNPKEPREFHMDNGSISSFIAFMLFFTAILAAGVSIAWVSLGNLPALLM